MRANIEAVAAHGVPTHATPVNSSTLVMVLDIDTVDTVPVRKVRPV